MKTTASASAQVTPGMKITAGAVMEENPLIAAYRAEKIAERHHRRCWLLATGASPSHEDFADYRAACRGLDAARAFSAKLDAEMNARASF